MNLLIVKGSLFAALLITAAVWDMRKRQIPDGIPLVILPVGIIGLSFTGLLSSLIGAILTALPYFLASVLVKKKDRLAVGGGDVKLMAGCRFILGVWGGILQSILALSLAVLAGMVVAALKRKINLSIVKVKAIDNCM